MSIKDRVLERGLPDWANVRKANTYVALDDMGELAVRLGSIVSHDRRGDVSVLDGFEDGLTKWQIKLLGGVNSVTLSNVSIRNGSYAALIDPNIASPWAGGLFLLRAYPPTTRFGLECSFAFNNVPLQIFLQIRLFDGSTVIDYALKYDHAANVLSYKDSLGSFTNLVSPITLTPGIYLFHTIKVVGSISDKKYVRAIVDSTEYSMSGISAYNPASGTASSMRVDIDAQEDPGAGATIYVDDVVVTVNEP